MWSYASFSYSQGYGFSSGHVWMWELHYKESWALKNWCFWTVVLEKTLESPLDCKEIQPVHPKGNQAWIFIGRTDAEAETPILWPLDEKNWLTWKDPDAGKVWRREEKGTTEDEMVGWHHSPWGHKESDTTEQLNSNNKVCTSLTTELEGLQVSMHWIVNPIRVYWTAAGAKHS